MLTLIHEGVGELEYQGYVFPLYFEFTTEVYAFLNAVAAHIKAGEKFCIIDWKKRSSYVIEADRTWKLHFTIY